MTNDLPTLAPEDELEHLCDMAYEAVFSRFDPPRARSMRRQTIALAPEEAQQMVAAVRDVVRNLDADRMRRLRDALSVAASVIADDLDHPFLIQHPDILEEWAAL